VSKKNQQPTRPAAMLPDEPIVPGVPPTAEQIQRLNQLMVQATRLQEQGKLPEAEKTLRQLLQAAPNHPFALHLLGVIAHQAGKPDMAIKLIGRAISVNDKIALFHANLGELLRTQKQLEAAVRHGEKAIALEPKLPLAQSNLGIAYYDQEEYEKAKECQQRALQLDPNLPQALNNMGSILRHEKNAKQAMLYYQKAIAANSRYLEPLNNLGLLLIEDGRAEEAVISLSNAVQQNPNYSDAQCNLGAAYTMLDQFEKAFACYQAALKARPDYVQAHLGLARLLQERNQFAHAEAAAKKAIELEPDKAGSYSVLASIYMDKNLPLESEKYFDKALELDPDLIAAHMGKGHMYMEDGRFDEAEVCFRRALELDPELYGPRYSLTQLRKVSQDDDNFKALIERKDIESIPVREAIPYYYALGKSYDDIGEYERGFENYMEGAKLKRSTIHYDPAHQDIVADALSGIFTQEFIGRLSGKGDSSDVPIFILGMPRSGTTLVEQIIASHPDVYGAGELPDLKELALRPVGTAANNRFPANLAALTPQTAAAMGREYVAGLQKRAPDARHITDKMPGNYQLVGLIHLILPNAKIVHVKRDPIDTCVSCYTRLFRHNQNQSYDLYEQGLFYRSYDRIMQYWRSVLPTGSFYEIQYEELVKDTDNQARSLIEFCNLGWHDDCLKFYETKRSVRTASVTQVRQPIYTSSMEKWRRYDKYLGPLKEGLGDLV
jgi:tetratricopeptide (TPR) repeat protein